MAFSPLTFDARHPTSITAPLLNTCNGAEMKTKIYVITCFGLSLILWVSFWLGFLILMAYLESNHVLTFPNWGLVPLLAVMVGSKVWVFRFFVAKIEKL